jgi:mRNA interferase RelE/StbE
MYAVEIEKRCLRELKTLDKPVVQKAFDLIERVVAKDPYSGKALKGRYRGMYSYRFSNYRIVYEIKRERLVVVILRVRHRKNVYDGL